MSEPNNNLLPLLAVSGLSKRFAIRGGLFSGPRRWANAVNDVSFSLQRGESLGLVGESGCGKSTLARLVTRLLWPTQGSIRFDGREISQLSRSEMRPLRRKMQIIFQDPFASLDPRLTIEKSITEPMDSGMALAKKQRRSLALDLLKAVGLQAQDLGRFPHEFSGGQRQRICIARALCVRPKLVVADEPVSALDVSIQAQILNLMGDLQAQFGLTYLLISHDIGVVDHFCDRVAVMYAGHLVEEACVKDFYRCCRHPYSQALVNAVPQPDPAQPMPPVPVEGEPPDPAALPKGCPYHPRCVYAFEPCTASLPPLLAVGNQHRVACWYKGGEGAH